MRVRFAAQPFENGQDLRDFLESTGHDADFTELRASVAWAKRSGLMRVRQSLDAIRERGKVQLIVGISEGGATRQGLELALETASEVYIFHDPTGRTFHPKVYLGTGVQRALLLVGSHNLTAGGVYYNYEAGLTCELDLASEADHLLATEVGIFFDQLLADQAVCKRLDAELLSKLLEDPTYRIGDEDVNRPSPSPAEDEEGAPEDTDTVTEDETDRVPIFGRSATRKRSGPLVGVIVRRPAGRVSAAAEVSPPEGLVVKRWWKKMRGSDAQHPPRPTSAVTGNLRLAKAGHPIDHKIYFRNDFFEDANWEQVNPGDPSYEMCFVEMDVVVEGDRLGVMPFRIDYKPSRIADQNNVSTVLKWGGLGTRLRHEDHTNEFVVLEKLSNGTYIMSIQSGEPEEFIE